ncbi:MAG: carbonic anhydrase, partial [Thermodesulfobacteriota bacterium]
HVVAQIENLKTYAIVDKSIKEEKVGIHGWYFDIPTGELYIYNERKKTFEKLTRGKEEAGGRGYEASEEASTDEL